VFLLLREQKTARAFAERKASSSDVRVNCSKGCGRSSSENKNSFDVFAVSLDIKNNAFVVVTFKLKTLRKDTLSLSGTSYTQRHPTAAISETYGTQGLTGPSSLTKIPLT
jgi:hypothetical protein